MRRFGILSSIATLFLLVSLQAEYTFFTPPSGFAVEVSLENSSYLRLPIYRNAITSLEVAGDYAVGGTSARPGLSPFVFSVSLSRRQIEGVVDVSKVVPRQRAIRSGFGRGSRGVLYAGTMPEQAGDSGHLLEVETLTDVLKVEDLGVPVEGEGVFAVLADYRAPFIYGISHPSGRFFVYSLQTRQTRVLSETALSKPTLSFLAGYALRTEDVLSRRLAVDSKGRVYGSTPVNKLFCFDPRSQKINFLPDELPEVWGRRPLGRVDAWALATNGMLYGGNAGDGQLFKLDPESGRVTNLGKPVMMPRIGGLAFGADGKLYGIGGASPGSSHLFSYDPQGNGFVDLGNPRFVMIGPGIEQGIFWRGFQIGTMTASEDGKYIVMGEEEALSQVMVFAVK